MSCSRLFNKASKNVNSATSSKGFKISLLVLLAGISTVYLFLYEDYTDAVWGTKKLIKNVRVGDGITKIREILEKTWGNISQKEVDSQQQQPQPPGAKQAMIYSHVLGRSRQPSRECTFPTTDPFDPGVTKILKTYPPLDCSNNTANIVYLEGDVLSVKRSKLSLVLSPEQNFSHCQCKEVSRKNGSDKAFEFTNTTAKFSESVVIQPWQQNVFVECFDSKNVPISRSYFPLIKKKVDIETRQDKRYQEHKEKNAPLETLSIFMIGIDGMSKQNFERAMPKTRKFLMDKMEAIELHKYNKLAFETFGNVLALLTGRTPKDFYRDWHYNKTEFMDQINDAFLWSEARKLGYRTGLILDCYDITAFHYQKKGFKVSPVDYYQRPTVIASSRDKLMRGKNPDCVGDMPEVTQIYDYWLQMARTFGKNKTTPFLAYSFAAHLTHDESDFASKGDEAYLKFLQDLVATDALNNTLILWFSDHGPRFGPFRQSYHGRIETSTPYLFFVFPPWFQRKYPTLISTLRINQNRLASHFDVYETLKDLLYFKNDIFENKAGTLTERGISLFREIPAERTCANAGIPGEFCACGRFSKTYLTPRELHQLSMAVLDKVNSYIGFGLSSSDGGKASAHVSSGTARNTSSENPPMSESSTHEKVQKTPCAPLSLLGMESVYHVTNDQLRSLETKSYRVTIRTKPGLALFEGLVNFKSGKEAHVVGGVVRINMYRGQADCVHDPWLRQFCFCVK